MRRTIAARKYTEQFVNASFVYLDILLELLLSLLSKADVSWPMRADLVTCAMDGSHELRITMQKRVCYKERGCCASAGQEFKERFCNNNVRVFLR